MGSRFGITQVAAKRVGLSVLEYQAKRKQGLKWCWKCRLWKEKEEFDLDKSRGDGRTAICIDCRRVKVRRQRRHSPPSVKVREDASNALRKAIRQGRITKPSALPCHDCGKPARQYHHHLGYAHSHWLDVVAVCVSCHHRRHWDDNPNGNPVSSNLRK